MKGDSYRFQERNYIFAVNESFRLIKDIVKYVLLNDQYCYLGFYQRSEDVHLSKGILIYILLKEQSHRSDGRTNCVEFSKGTVIWVLLNEKSCSAVNVY